jgi:hypothetical protein
LPIFTLPGPPPPPCTSMNGYYPDPQLELPRPLPKLSRPLRGNQDQVIFKVRLVVGSYMGVAPAVVEAQ